MLQQISIYNGPCEEGLRSNQPFSICISSTNQKQKKQKEKEMRNGFWVIFIDIYLYIYILLRMGKWESSDYPEAIYSRD